MKLPKEKIIFFNSIKKFSPNEFNILLNYLNEEGIDSLCEFFYNTIYTDLPIPPGKKRALRNKLKKNCCMKNLKHITEKSIHHQLRKKALKQEGKGLGFILSTVVPVLAKLLL